MRIQQCDISIIIIIIISMFDNNLPSYYTWLIQNTVITWTLKGKNGYLIFFASKLYMLRIKYEWAYANVYSLRF